MVDSLADMSLDRHIIRLWKSNMMEMIQARFPNIKKSKVEKYLDKKIMSYGRNPKLVVVNNYRNYELKTNLLELIDYIEKYHIIIGGEACLFVPHPENEDDVHVVIRFIEYNKSQRNYWKEERKKFDKGTFGWLSRDIKQNNKKLKNNALYGCEGCPSFILFNRFIASSITNTGRQIICTATMIFENFLGIDVKYNMESEVYTFIKRVRDHIKEDFPRGIDTSDFDDGITLSKVVKKLQSRCAFPVTTEFASNLMEILSTFTQSELTILYYKNNLMEFCHTKKILIKLRYIMSNIDQMRSPYIGELPFDVQCAIEELNNLLDTYVTYSDPMFDRVRKTMFTDRDKVLYTDTDSTFLALNQWVTFIKEEVLENNYRIQEMEMNFIAVNVITYLLGFVIAKGLKGMCDGMAIEEVWAKLLKMKNEFYLAMIVFTNAKKRYISNAYLQEGKFLIDSVTGEIGYPEIKGFDFKKAVVKPFVTEYYTNLSVNGILKSEEIRVDYVYGKMLELKKAIEESIDSGSREYYKQAKVKLIEQYKKPYQQQQVRAVLLWNCLFEDMPLELPVDVDIMPIKTISDKKGRAWLESKYPELYIKINRDFFQSDNESLRNMELKVIALPKTDVKIPDWLFEWIDREKIVSDILSLFYPIMESLGLQTNTVGKKVYMTNMVEL